MEPAIIGADMSVATTRIAFDGEALQQGAMDVRDLAPALLEIGSLCERANDLLSGGKTKVAINVRSDFKRGSFEVNIEVIQSLLSHAKNLIFSTGAQDAKYLLEWLGLGGVSTVGTVLGLYRILRGRKPRPENTTRLEDGKISITFNVTNNVTNAVTVNNNVFQLYSDDVVRARVEGALRPLLKPGIDIFESRDGDRVVEQISKEEAQEAYEARREDVESEEPPPITDSTYITPMTIMKIPFRDKLTWNFSIGAQRISAEMKDELFLDRHWKGETSYRTGDVLVVQLRSRVWRTPEGLKPKNEILEVIEHLHPAVQLNIE